MTVGDTTYSTGDYLAYLYNTYSQVYQNYNFAMYAQYGMDPWEITIPYGDDEEEMAAEDYIVKTTQDAMIRQKAIKDKLEEYGLSQDVTRLEVADTEQLAFLYQDRISVLLGTLNDLDYKLDRARYVLTNADGKGCGPTDTGRLDFSSISPVSSPAFIRMVVTPASFSPLSTAHWMGAAPRYFGRRDAWTLMQPSGGISRIRWERILP